MSLSSFARGVLHLVAFLGFLQCVLGNWDVYRIDLITYPPYYGPAKDDNAGNASMAEGSFNGTFADISTAQNSLNHYWIVLPPDWVCRYVLDARLLVDKKDVSRKNIGVRCRGDGCNADHSTDNIDLIEMNWAQVPVLHWTLYKDRLDQDQHQILWSLEENPDGACAKIGTPGKWDSCFDKPVGLGNTKTYFVHKKFHCWNQYDWKEINAGM